MFIPLIIAILMGLVTPTTNNANCNSGTVYVSNNEPNGDDPGDPGDGEGDDDGTGSGTGTGETGIGGPGDGTGTGGGSGQNPPPKP